MKLDSEDILIIPLSYIEHIYEEYCDGSYNKINEYVLKKQESIIKKLQTKINKEWDVAISKKDWIYFLYSQKYS